MRPPDPPCRDILGGILGSNGIRARRTGSDDTADSIVDVSDVRLDPAVPGDLARTVTAVATLTERDGPAPEATCWSIPAAWGDGAAEELISAARTLWPATRTVVVTDSVATHVGAFGGVRPGTCLDIGAGASALVTDHDQIWHRIDGWGLPLGGRGSGAWIGAHGLAAATRAHDGVNGGSDELLLAARKLLGPERTWSAQCTAPHAETTLTSFAPVVCEMSNRDPIARAVVAAAGEHLAEALAVGRSLLVGTPVVAVGGLLYLEAVRKSLAAALARRRMFLVPGLGGALEGAHLIGEHLLGGGNWPHRPPYIWMDSRGELPR